MKANSSGTFCSQTFPNLSQTYVKTKAKPDQTFLHATNLSPNYVKTKAKSVQTFPTPVWRSTRNLPEPIFNLPKEL